MNALYLFSILFFGFSCASLLKQKYVVMVYTFIVGIIMFLIASNVIHGDILVQNLIYTLAAAAVFVSIFYHAKKFKEEKKED